MRGFYTVFQCFVVEKVNVKTAFYAESYLRVIVNSTTICYFAVVFTFILSISLAGIGII